MSESLALDPAGVPAPEQSWGGTYPISGADYYWHDEPEALAQKLKQKITQWRNERLPLTARARKNWYTYYNLDGGRASWQDDLYPSGELGENVRLRVGLARNLVQHILVNTNSVRPSLNPLAKNSDAASNRQINIGRSIAEDVMEEGGGYTAVNRATEYCQVLDDGFVEGEWDESGGGLYAQGVSRGTHKFNVLTPLDVFFDLAQPDWESHSFIGTRKWRNKHDLISIYPGLKTEILNAQRKGINGDSFDLDLPNPAGYEVSNSELVEVFTFYHCKSPALPLGRKIIFLSTGQWLSDEPLAYEKVPVWRVASADVLGTSFGFGPLTSLGSTQEAFNKMLSMAATTLFTHGVSNIGVSKSANFDATDLGGGQRVYELDIQPGQGVHDVIGAIQLTQLPPEILMFAKDLNSLAEQDAGLNKIVRGDPGGVTAGVALSLYQAMAQQFQGPVEERRGALIKSLVMWSWEALRVHSPNMERWVQIVGQGKREALQKFMGKDLEGMERLEVDLGNPLARTPAGRVQMVQMLKQDGQPLPPQVIFDVMSTGKMEVATEPDSDEMDLIRQENSMILDGNEPIVMLGQDDALHIFHHVQTTLSQDLASVPERKLAAEQHMRAHLAKMGQGDLVLLARRGTLQQGFASPMFNQTPPAGGAGAKGAGAKDAHGGKKGAQGVPDALKQGTPQEKNPLQPAPLSGASPQQ